MSIRISSLVLCSAKQGREGLLTAAVERGPSEGARSGSKESSSRPCIPPSETARCTSTGNHQAPSPSLLQPSTKRSGRGCPSLRASDEHILIVRVLRARRAPGHSPLYPSETARCTSTGDHLVCPLISFQARSLSLQGWGLIDLPLRASNEGSPRPRVARARKIIRPHPLLFSGSTD